MLKTGANHEIFQVLLISLQRIEQEEEAEQTGEKILAATAQQPWDQPLLRVTLGQADGGRRRGAADRGTRRGGLS